MPLTLARTVRFAAGLATDLLFPPRCALCDRDGALLCAECIDALPPADGPRCARCWMPVVGATTCRHCDISPPAFASLAAGFIMEAGARQLVHDLKYDGLTSLAEPMARIMLEGIDLPPADIVVAVPLHRSRERVRGYNQSALLAREIARHTSVPYERNALRRTRATAPLAKTMHREERRAIVQGAFAARRDAVEGRAILLIDDVATTGATLDACAEALLAAGATGIRCVTWARAD